MDLEDLFETVRDRKHRHRSHRHDDDHHGEHREFRHGYEPVAGSQYRHSRHGHSSRGFDRFARAEHVLSLLLRHKTAVLVVGIVLLVLLVGAALLVLPLLWKLVAYVGSTGITGILERLWNGLPAESGN